ncbi:tellurite resistance TerB family protein [Halomonas caseinilytica]|uniref:tellurite resistance TerB family protein n=2 Tax=Halomonas caseinilytica TaxID=438744 RepID=UPI0007E56AB3|nr:TerB family tellurite resistance protein [Halomonas caseinilytica]
MFGKMFNKRMKQAQQNLKNVENRDLMEAIVGGCLLIAAADGEIEQEETDKLDQLLRSNQRLQGFGGEITQTIQRFRDQLEAGFQVGRLQILREIGDIASDREHAEEVLVNMITIAGSDGEFEDEEVVVIKEVAGKLGLNPTDYGLPA